MENRKSEFTSDIVFTKAVKEIQERMGSRKSYAVMEERGAWQTEIDSSLEQFIANIDSFYFGTANGKGQPYIQHRGGPMGFLKVLDNKRLAFADFSGNRQYISIGNLAENNKSTIFLMDYPNRTRIKIWGTTAVVDDDAELLKSLSDSSYRSRVERALVFTVAALDVNCPQHIQPRFTKEQLDPILNPLKERITELESILKEKKIAF
ncbi:MAG: pyridoxamine 5'-phosphate oxidase family protein [Maribacter sp.]|uniref:pyridoxamine 5'-phosphate oxidase family protein n=1 Tax=Maribacter sp. TaxID=1897614 RepID=UPI003298E4CC